jgi:hypothetical protein
VLSSGRHVPTGTSFDDCRQNVTPASPRRVRRRLEPTEAFDTKLDPKTDLPSGFDRFSPDNIAANMPIVDLLTRFAATENASPARIALAWLRAQEPFIVSIPAPATSITRERTSGPSMSS